MMQIFSRIEKDLPAIIVATIAASSSYNSGFLLSTETGIATTLSYNDLLNGTIYLFPFVILLYVFGNGLIRFTQNDFDFGKKSHIFIIALMFITGVSLLLISRKETVDFPVTIIFISLSPFIIRFLYRIFDKTDKKILVQFVSIFFVLTVLFFHGYSNFHWSISPRNNAYVTIAGCEKCRLVKIYSDFMILYEGADKPLRFPRNDKDFSIERAGADQSDVL